MYIQNEPSYEIYQRLEQKYQILTVHNMMGDFYTFIGVFIHMYIFIGVFIGDTTPIF